MTATFSFRRALMNSSVMLVTLVSIAIASPAAQGPPAQPATASQPSVPGSGAPTTPPRPGMPSSPARDPSMGPANPVGTAVIRGRVVAMDTGAPLRRVQIRVMGQEVRSGRAVLTDAQGRYEIKELPAGRFQLTATKGGYVILTYGQRRPLDPGRPIEVADGQTIEKIDFSLPRGGVITGRVIDELGEPVSDTNVQALVFRLVNGRRRLMPAGNFRGASTNDVGQFRLFGLPPGEYYVATGAPSETFVMAEGGLETSSGYARTYYPGTPSLSEAQRVTVSIGEELNIDIQLVPTRVSRITGTATDSTGRALSTGMVMLQPRDAMLMMGGGLGGSMIKPDGSFVVSNVTPGTYYLSVQMFSMSPTGDREVASLPITVAGQDIENVRLVTSRGGTIQGRLVYEGSAPPNAQVGVTCMPTDPEGPFMMAGASGMSDAQQQYEMKGVHGPCTLRAMRTPPGWAMKAVLHDGQDITDRPITLSAGKSLTGVDIVLTTRQTVLSGSVTDDQGKAVKEFVVVAFPDDKDKWGHQTRFIRSSRADQDGQFKLTGLPPGEYLVVAVDTLEQGAELDPELLERMRPMGMATRLSDGGTQAITLKMTSIKDQ